MLSLHILEEEHMKGLETALAAQRLVQNDEIRALWGLNGLPERDVRIDITS